MAAAALLSSAQGLFRGSSLAANYTLETGPARQSAVIGLWTIQKALHKNGKAVSIWTFDKSVLSGARTRVKLDSVLEILKKEVSMLTRLRHPCVLEMVEPLQETRTSLTFATEQVTGSLKTAILASDSTLSVRRGSSDDAAMNELDEIEIQKGLLQIGKALQFLHESAKLVHSNLTTEAIVINAKGDWKLSGFGLSTYLSSSTGEATRWEFPSFDRNLPQAVQKDFDYMAPEFALDESLLPANDMYSLGCVLHAIHTKSGPPFSNHGSLQSLRDNMENITTIRAGWHRFGDEVQDVLSQLLTRYPGSRMSAATFQSSRYFSSILVSTLRFLDRENFAAKPREEQASFLKGLLKVLPQFSDKVVKRKILPSLLEETRKNMLVPFLLPCIFYIGHKMNNNEFAELLLPSLKPLFTMRDPPQAMMTLLDNLPLLQSKCSASVFREEVLPLVYNALESDIAPLLDKVLRIVPSLSEGLDYTTVKTTFLPKITNVFSKTTSLSVKVATLNCFKSLVPILDKYTLTEKLVPLLARIKTKEPSVMIATLAVHEQIGLKCDIQALATLVLPQLWAMSITPLLSAEQFARFMATIKQLGARVEEEQSKHLAEIRRLEETSAGASRAQRASLAPDGEVDFESLVRGPQANGRNGSITPDPFGTSDDFSSFDSLAVGPSTTSPSMSSNSASAPSFSITPSVRPSGSNVAPSNSAKAASFLGARPISNATYQARSGLAVTPDSSAPSSPSLPPLQPSVRALPPPMPASFSASSGMTSAMRPLEANNATANGGPNYNLNLPPQNSHTSSLHAPIQPSNSSYMQPLQPSLNNTVMQPLQPSGSGVQMAPNGGAIQWNTASMAARSGAGAAPAWTPSQVTPAAPPGWGGSTVLQPSKKESSYDWSDLDPMR